MRCICMGGKRILEWRCCITVNAEGIGTTPTSASLGVSPSAGFGGMVTNAEQLSELAGWAGDAGAVIGPFNPETQEMGTKDHLTGEPQDTWARQLILGAGGLGVYGGPSYTCVLPVWYADTGWAEAQEGCY